MLRKKTILNHRWHSSVVFLFAAVIVASVFSVVITSRQVGAITDAQAKHCIATYPTGTTIATRAPGSGTVKDATDGDWAKNKCGEICTTRVVTVNIPPSGSQQNTVVQICKDSSTGGGGPGSGEQGPAPPTTTASTAIYNHYNQLLLDKYCPDSMGDKQVGCITKVNNASAKCIPKNATSAAINFKKVAQCLQNNSPDTPKLVAKDIEPLLKKGQSGAQQAAASATAALKCNEDPSKTWDPAANEGKGDCVDGSSDNESSCNIDGVGWLVCPVINFIAKLNDAAYVGVSALLEVPPISTKTDSPLFTAWSIMRNFANVAFVIAFMIIIYSQITGFGVSNYGIKKLLPKIIISAILVNVSYWICALAVDLSNVSGSSIKGLFDSIIATLDKGDSYGNGGQSVANQWTVGAGLILAATGAALFITLSTFLPIAVAALAAVVTAVVVLVARQAIIILLIFISPLAFVAFLLPNTDQWFNRWRKTFFAMLLMFPLVALVFGASALASFVLAQSAGGQISDKSNFDNNAANMLVQVAAMGVALIPLFITPILMKASTGILGQIGAFVNNPNKGPFDKMRKRAEGYNERRKNIATGRRLGGTNAFKMRADKWKQSDSRFARASGRALGVAASTGAVGTYSAKRAVDRQKMDENAKIGADAAGKSYYTKSVSDGDYAMKMASGNTDMATLVQAYGIQAGKEEDIKDIKAERVLLEHDLSKGDISMDGLITTMNTEGMAKAAAAAAIIGERGSGEQVQQALNDLRSNGGTVTSSDARSMAQQQLISNLKSDQFGLGQGDKTALANGTYGEDGKTYDQKLADRALKKMSGETIAGLQPHDSQALTNLAKSNQLDKSALQNVVNSIQAARDNPNLNARIKDEARKQHDQILQKAADQGIRPSGSAAAAPAAELTIPHSDAGSKPAASTNPAPTTSSAPPVATPTTASTTASSASAPVSAPTGGTTQSVTGSSTPSSGGSVTIDRESADRIGRAVADNTPSAPPRPSIGSVDENNRFTPGGVQNPDDYHEGMQK